MLLLISETCTVKETWSSRGDDLVTWMQERTKPSNTRQEQGTLDPGSAQFRRASYRAKLCSIGIKKEGFSKNQNLSSPDVLLQIYFAQEHLT
jgi:hypothetical protein